MSPSPPVRALALLLLASAVPGCLGVGLYAELNGGSMHAELARRSKNSDRAATTWVPTYGFSLGTDFEFAHISYLGLGYTSHGATLRSDREETDLRALELTAMSSIPALATRSGRGGLLPRAIVAAAWNNDSRAMKMGMAGLGVSLVAGPKTMWTLMAGATAAQWQMAGGDLYRAVGGLGRLRLTYTTGRKTGSR